LMYEYNLALCAKTPSFSSVDAIYYFPLAPRLQAIQKPSFSRL
jgi:hypothetical protein